MGACPSSSREQGTVKPQYPGLLLLGAGRVLLEHAHPVPREQGTVKPQYPGLLLPSTGRVLWEHAHPVLENKVQ